MVLLGIDTSTTATKALLMNAEGGVVGVASSDHSLSTPEPLWAEQDPRQWWEAAQESIRQVLTVSGVDGAAVRGVGLTGQMHGLVMLDRKGRVLRPAILWNDQRAAAECDQIRDRLGVAKLVAITGNDAYPGFTAPKLLWVRNHEPELYRQIEQVLLPKDYIRFRLTGDYATDRAGAGGTLLLDLEARDWSRELLEELEIPLRWLPGTHEGTEETGRISAEAAVLTGLSAGTPVFGGGGDQAAQAVGVGALEPGIIALSLGTSGVVFAASDRPLIQGEGRLHSFPHAVPGRWHVMGVMLSAAGSLRWYRDVIGPGLGYDTLLAEAKEIDPGSEGLIFLPYLSGERTPHADPHLRALFSGLTLRHRRAHLTRAVLEGVAFGLRDNLVLMEEVGLDSLREVRLSGGGAKSRLWRQIIADVCDVTLAVVDVSEAAASGAALLAGVGCGTWGSVAEACDASVEPGEITRPQAETREVYDHAWDRFREHYPAVRPLFTGERHQALDQEPGGVSGGSESSTEVDT